MSQSSQLPVIHSATDRLVEANHHYADTVSELDQKKPRLKVAILSCMDTRLNLETQLGLLRGDAHMIRNAGGLVTDDALRSLAISQQHLGTREIMIVQHTDCGMLNFDDAKFRAELAHHPGPEPAWDVPGFTDVEESLRASMRRLRAIGWLITDSVRGFVLDAHTSRLRELH